MAKKSVSVVAVIVALLVLSGGAAAGLGVSFSQIQFVSFGEVESLVVHSLGSGGSKRLV